MSAPRTILDCLPSLC